MTDDKDGGLIEIRTFASIEEIKLLEGYRDSNPVNKDNYDGLYGDYWFPDEVKWCREKENKQLCGTGHNWGFVVKLKDSSTTIVGNCCARDKFGADSRIKADRNKYLNEKRRREKLALLGDLIANKEDQLRKLLSIQEKVERPHKEFNDFVESLEKRTIRKLHDLQRSGNSTIYVDVITYRDYIDEYGEKQVERRSSPARIGHLNGIDIFDEFAFRTVYFLINSVRSAYENAENFSDKIKASELDALTSSIANFSRVESEVAEIEKDFEDFFNNDLTGLCFLVDDKSERYKTARTILERTGEPIGRDKAKTWLIEQEQRIKKILNADKIGIQG